MNRRTALATSAVAAVSLLLGGCSATSGATNHTTGVQVSRRSNPLQYVTQQVGGHLVQVTSLTPARRRAARHRALPTRGARAVSDGRPRGLPVGVPERRRRSDRGTQARARGGRGRRGRIVPAQGTEAKNGTLDPHFWLDPQRLARLAAPRSPRRCPKPTRTTPARTRERSDARAKLGAWTPSTAPGSPAATARHRHVAQRVRLPRQAPTASRRSASRVWTPTPSRPRRRLREIRTVVKADGVTTLFTERLISPKVAQTLRRTSASRSRCSTRSRAWPDPHSD